MKKFNIFGFNPKIQETSQIELKKFVDFDLDVVGWYAQGHHNAEKFLSIVAEKEPYIKFSSSRVRWSWVKLHDNGFEEVNNVALEAMPITFIAIYGVDVED